MSVPVYKANAIVGAPASPYFSFHFSGFYSQVQIPPPKKPSMFRDYLRSVFFNFRARAEEVSIVNPCITANLRKHTTKLSFCLCPGDPGGSPKVDIQKNNASRLDKMHFFVWPSDLTPFWDVLEELLRRAGRKPGKLSICPKI